MVGPAGDFWRPQSSRDGPPPPPPDMYYFQANRGNLDPRPQRTHDRRDFRRRAPLATADRPLLQSLQNGKEESFAPRDGHNKFRNPAELTDSEESAMDVSADESDAAPASKRARTQPPSALVDTQPKWSNPDPYTALPPPLEASGKKVDLVKLIRKARMEHTKEDNTEAEAEDFISFGMEEESERGYSPPPADAPTGPRTGSETNLGKRKRDQSTVAARRRAVNSGRGSYGDGMILREWVSNSQSPSTPWVTTIDPTDPPSTALHKEVIDFYQWVRPQEYEAAVRADLVDRLSKAMNRLEPGQLKAFGSYAAGLYLPTADMDLVYIDRSFNPRKVGPDGLPPKPRFGVLNKWSYFLRQQKIAREGSILVIAHAKVPIIKFVEDATGLKVDLSFNNNTGVVAIETFHKWKQEFPAMPIIVSIVKQYLMIRGLNDVAVGGLGGFSTICLVTSMLQHLPVAMKAANLGQLLVEFFNLYGTLFAKDDVGIRLDPPGYVDKDTYKLMRVGNDRRNRLMIIDPNRPDNNISGGTNEIDRILACFENAHELLQVRLAEHASYGPGETATSLLQDLVGGNFEAYEAQRVILRDLHYGGAGNPAPAIIPSPPPPLKATPVPPPPLPVKATPVPPPPPSITTFTPINGRGGDPDVQDTSAAQSDDSGSDDESQDPSSPISESKKSGKVLAKNEGKKNKKRAKRLKKLRPDIACKVPMFVSKLEAVELGGYENIVAMQNDLNARQQQKTQRIREKKQRKLARQLAA